MKGSVAFATIVACCLSGSVVGCAWAGDLEAALENISIRTDAANAPKKVETNTLPCTKVVDAQCPIQDDELDRRNNQAASAIPETVLNGSIPNVTINGAAVDTVNYKSAIATGGF